MYAHDSILGGLNLFLRSNNNSARSLGERPTFPPIKENPTFFDTLDNTNTADLGILLAFIASSVPLSSYISRRYLTSYSHRITSFNLMNLWWIAFGANVALVNSASRLKGSVENGLEWKHGVLNLKKYDLTSEYEQNTIWSMLRRR